MGFTSKSKTKEASAFEMDRVLISKLRPSNNPKFDRIFVEKEDGSRERLFLAEGEEAPENAIRIRTVAVEFRESAGIKDNRFVFNPEMKIVYVPETAFKNKIEIPEMESYGAEIGAVAILEGTIATSEHDAGALKKGDEYVVVSSVVFTTDNRTIATANSVANGATLQF
jgi:hypothetical protein